MSEFTSACLTGCVFASVYIAVAVCIIRSDRRATGGFFRAFGSCLAVLPITAILERLGYCLDYRSNLQMSLAVLLTAALVCALGYALGAAVDALFALVLR